MKRYLALIFFALVVTVTFAQSNSKEKEKKREKISFVVKGGLNLSNLLVKDNETTYSKDFKSKPGKWGTNSGDTFKRLDFGMIASVGTEISSIQFSLYYI